MERGGEGQLGGVLRLLQVSFAFLRSCFRFFFPRNFQTLSKEETYENVNSQEATSRAAGGSKEAWLDVYNDKVPVTFAKVLSWLNSNAETIEAGGEVIAELKKEVTGLLKLYAKKGMGEVGELCLEDLVEVIVVMVTKQVAEMVNQTREVEV